MGFEKKFRKVFETWARDWFGLKIGYRAYWHPTGDICPECQATGEDANLGVGHCMACGCVAPWKPHLNLLVPLAGVETDGSVHRLRCPGETSPGFVPGKALTDLRDRTHAIMIEMAEVIGLPQAITANVWWQLYWGNEGPHNALHALAYNARSFPGYRTALASLHHGQDYGALCGRKDSPYRLLILGGKSQECENPKCQVCKNELRPSVNMPGKSPESLWWRFQSGARQLL